MNGELRAALEITGLVTTGVVGIFAVGRWFGWKHRELLGKISGVESQVEGVKRTLDTHIKDEDRTFARIEARIEHLCNGNKKG